MHGPNIRTQSSNGHPTITSICDDINTGSDSDNSYICHTVSESCKDNINRNTIGVWKQVIMDRRCQHEMVMMSLDMNSVIRQEEESLTSLLGKAAHAPKEYLEHETETSPLLALGDDVLETILGYLDPKDLCHAEECCQSLQRVVNTAPIWDELDLRYSSSSPSLSYLVTPKERVQHWYIASQRAKQWERLAPSHSCQLNHFGCRGCSKYPDHLDTQALHNKDDYSFFLRISHKDHGKESRHHHQRPPIMVVYEGFVEVEHHKETFDADDDEEEDNLFATTTEQTEDENENPFGAWQDDMSWLPYHPEIPLHNLLPADWGVWENFKESWNSSSECPASLEHSAQRLVTGLAVTLIALPKVTSSCPCPRLVVSTVGNKNLMEPFMKNDEDDDNDDTISSISSPIRFPAVNNNNNMQSTAPSWDIPLEASRMASHFVDSADHAQSFLSELQVDLVVGKNNNSKKTPSLALQFPDILIHDSDGDANMVHGGTYYY